MASTTRYAFGRHISSSNAQKIATPTEEALKFTFEKAGRLSVDTVDVPYHEQGDPAFDREPERKARDALLVHPEVVEELERWWQLYEPDDLGTIDKGQYLYAHSKLARVLIPELSAQQAAEAAEEDWIEDAEGADRMSKAQVQRSLFQLVDVYTTTISAIAYASFLRKLFERVTVKYVRTMAAAAAKAAASLWLASTASEPPARARVPRLQAVAAHEDDLERGTGMPASNGLAATGDDSHEAIARGAPTRTSTIDRDGVSPAQYGWADDEDVFPLILYGNEPVDYAALRRAYQRRRRVTGAAAEAMEEAHEEERTGGGGTAAGVGGSGAAALASAEALVTQAEGEAAAAKAEAAAAAVAYGEDAPAAVGAAKEAAEAAATQAEAVAAACAAARAAVGDARDEGAVRAGAEASRAMRAVAAHATGRRDGAVGGGGLGVADAGETVGRSADVAAVAIRKLEVRSPPSRQRCRQRHPSGR